MKKKILMQGEADKSLKKNSHFFFYSENPLEVGEKIIPTNYSTTMRTHAVVLEKKSNMYHAVVITNDPVADRLDLTQLL